MFSFPLGFVRLKLNWHIKLVPHLRIYMSLNQTTSNTNKRKTRRGETKKNVHTQTLNKMTDSKNKCQMNE